MRENGSGWAKLVCRPRRATARRIVAAATGVILILTISLPAIAVACAGGEEHSFNTIVILPSPVVFTKAGRENITIENGNLVFFFEIEDVFASGLPFKAVENCKGITLSAGSSCPEEVEYSGTFKKGEKGSLTVKTFLGSEKIELKS